MKRFLLAGILLALLTLMSCKQDTSIWGEVHMYNQLNLYLEHLEKQIETALDSSLYPDSFVLIDEVYSFIDTIKLKLIHFENPDLSFIEFEKEKMILNKKPVEVLLLGNEKKGLAYELNKRLTTLKNELISLFKSESFLIGDISLYLDTSVPPLGNEYDISWEQNTFECMTFISAENFLSLLQLNLLILKKDILTVEKQKLR